MIRLYMSASFTPSTNTISQWKTVNKNNYINCPDKILIYIQQDATLHSLFYLETALHVSGGTSTRHQERKQLCR